VNDFIVAPRWKAEPEGWMDERWSRIQPTQLVNARDIEAPALATGVRVVCTTGALWAQFVCEATDVRATMSRYNDKVWTEGAVEVFLKPPSAHHLFEFQLSPIGTWRDLRVDDPGGPNQSYDDSWRCAGLVASTNLRRSPRGDLVGWDALLGIPWASLGGANLTSDGWKFGAYRWEYEPAELSAIVGHDEIDAHDDRFLVELRIASCAKGFE
jgi:hypothetical protein